MESQTLSGGLFYYGPLALLVRGGMIARKDTYKRIFTFTFVTDVTLVTLKMS